MEKITLKFQFFNVCSHMLVGAINQKHSESDIKNL